MLSKQLLVKICFGLVVGIGLLSCERDPFTTNPNHKLEFSADTVRFDTVFSTISSITLELKVYNRHNKAIKINKLWLEGGSSSVFRFNADGYPSGQTKMLENIEIPANDSIFVFVEITPQANMQSTPVHVTDNLLFSLNGQTQKVILEAYGQDVVVLRNYSLAADETFSADKPYLIFGYLHIPKGKTLTLQAGTKIFINRGSKVILKTGIRNIQLDNTTIVVEGNLVANGTTDKRISIRGDRFDWAYTNIPYSYLPSQWGGIYFFSETGNNSLKNTTITGGNIGVLLYGSSTIPVKLDVDGSIVHCMGAYGILSQFGDLSVINSEVSNCGKSAILQLGGSLKMIHSTIANYMPSVFAGGNTSRPAVDIVSFTKKNGAVAAFPINSCVIENCIITGNLQNELSLQDTTLGIPFNVFISNCLIKAEKLSYPQLHEITLTRAEGNDIFVQTTPDFDNMKESGYFDFRLSEQSAARDKANMTVSQHYPTDLLGKDRLKDNKPDIGAYEK